MTPRFLAFRARRNAFDGIEYALGVLQTSIQFQSDLKSLASESPVLHDLTKQLNHATVGLCKALTQ
jgi:hypothetical protein